MNDTLRLRFGMLSPPLRKQLKSQGLTMREERAAHFQEIMESSTWLIVNGFITGVEAKKIERRIANAIAKEVEQERML